jgi:hypothetical protein
MKTLQIGNQIRRPYCPYCYFFFPCILAGSRSLLYREDVSIYRERSVIITIITRFRSTIGQITNSKVDLMIVCQYWFFARNNIANVKITKNTTNNKVETLRNPRRRSKATRWIIMICVLCLTIKTWTGNSSEIFNLWSKMWRSIFQIVFWEIYVNCVNLFISVYHLRASSEKQRRLENVDFSEINIGGGN